MSEIHNAAANLAALLYDPSAPIIDRFRGPWLFLSNTFPAVTVIDGLAYATSEHAFHALKSDDPAYRAYIASLPSNQWRDAKAAGNKVALRVPLEDWDATVRYEAMDEVLHAKFLTQPERVKALLSTGASLLIEGNNWHDRAWGVCRCDRPECRGAGENRLGRNLMALRSEIRATPQPSR